MQRSIFAAGPTGFDPNLAGLVREPLSAGAWVDYLPSWLGGHEMLFERLEAQVDWHAYRRRMYDRIVDVPRLTGSFPRPGCEPEAIIADMSAALSRHYSRALLGISFALYRDGRDSVAMHGDKVGRLADDCVVAIVALGAPRRFLLREVGGSGARTFALGWGDLLVMGGTCQRTWRHGIPKVARAGPRISIMFRQAPATSAAPPRQ